MTKKAMKRACQHIEWINNLGYLSVNPLLNKHKKNFAKSEHNSSLSSLDQSGAALLSSVRKPPIPQFGGNRWKRQFANLEDLSLFDWLRQPLSSARYFCSFSHFFRPLLSTISNSVQSKRQCYHSLFNFIKQKKNYNVRQRAQPEIQHTMTSGLRQSPTEYWFVN